jgi:hypothetical protein
MDLHGKHHSFVGRRGREVYNVSLRTLQPIVITGGLSRANRLVNSGQIEVNHNLAKFTALITPSNIQWSSDCCHPVSGSLSVTYSGSKTGTSTVTFQGCGSAQVNDNGQSEDIELSYCE